MRKTITVDEETYDGLRRMATRLKGSIGQAVWNCLQCYDRNRPENDLAGENNVSRNACADEGETGLAEYDPNKCEECGVVNGHKLSCSKCPPQDPDLPF